jgi:hypothetical protein
MKLETRYFGGEEDLASFVNRNNISKENIQSIAGNNEDGYVLFYWE